MQSNICTLKPETFFGEYVKPDGPAITAAQTLRRKLKGQQHRSFLVLEVFFKQEAAFLFKAQHPQATLSIFSFEDDPKNTGRRKYLVTSISDFWIRYKDMAKSQRHYYELIESGTPCHLYFDIEYDKTCNPGLDGDAALDAFQNYICKRLGDACAIDPKSICTIDLTSTTDVKFSRHLIMRVPGFAFQDNVHAGGFVARIVSDLTALREHYLDHQLKEPKQASSLMGLDTLLPVDPCIFLGFVFNAEGAVQFFVDMGVYTRNRNFRLWRSSKLAKKVELVASPRCLITDDEQGFRKLWSPAMTRIVGIFQSKEFPFPLDLSPLIDANALMEDEESHSCVEKRNQYEYTEEILDETILEALESDRTQFWG
ncbi:hypothetical protein BSLG_008636 [Batrachochytrium salamandrivorans]|nr:hypothetical protein BSLG_008636 [Batrachochytrium salamandrivorans]